MGVVSKEEIESRRERFQAGKLTEKDTQKW
jgi:hypothetical protein